MLFTVNDTYDCLGGTSYLLDTLVFSNSGSPSEHQPVQRLQNLQSNSIQDCGREYSRISASSASHNSGL